MVNTSGVVNDVYLMQLLSLRNVFDYIFKFKFGRNMWVNIHIYVYNNFIKRTAHLVDCQKTWYRRTVNYYSILFKLNY